MARRASRKVARLYPVKVRAAQARNTGSAWWRWWVLTVFTLMGAFGAFVVLSGLPMFPLVSWAQITS